MALLVASSGTAQEAVYVVQAGTLGNQSFGGSLGLDFDLNGTLTVVELGAFDSGSDGLTLPITIELWQRNEAGTPNVPGDDFGDSILATRLFAPGDDGTLDAVWINRFELRCQVNQ